MPAISPLSDAALDSLVAYVLHQSARPRPLLSKSRKIPLVESRRLLHLKSSVIEAASFYVRE